MIENQFELDKVGKSGQRPLCRSAMYSKVVDRYRDDATITLQKRISRVLIGIKSSLRSSMKRVGGC